MADEQVNWHEIETNGTQIPTKHRVEGNRQASRQAGRQSKNCLIVRCCQEECLQLIAICFGNFDCIVFSFCVVFSVVCRMPGTTLIQLFALFFP